MCTKEEANLLLFGRPVQGRGSLARVGEGGASGKPPALPLLPPPFAKGPQAKAPEQGGQQQAQQQALASAPQQGAPDAGACSAGLYCARTRRAACFGEHGAAHIQHLFCLLACLLQVGGVLACLLCG